MIKLKRCPFCGCDKLSTNFNYMRGLAYISCDQCYAQGPEVSEVEVFQADIIDRDSLKNAMIGISCDRWNGMNSIRPDRLEPLTDTEQRIFLTAMGREEKVCKEVEAVMGRRPYEDSLVRVCHEITRKVKSALWKN